MKREESARESDDGMQRRRCPSSPSIDFFENEPFDDLPALERGGGGGATMLFACFLSLFIFWA